MKDESINDRLPFKEAGSPTLEDIKNCDILTKEQLCVYLAVPMSTIRSLMKNKSFPKCKIGKHVRFNKEAVAKWIANKGMEA